MTKIEPHLSGSARPPRTPIRYHRVSGALWSFGYTWQIPSSAADLVRGAEIEAGLPSIQADLIAYRTRDIAQYGLGYLPSAARPKGMVAAIAFAEQMTKQHIRNAIGVFAVLDLYWLVSIKDDAIPPNNGDRLFNNLLEAIEAFIALYKRPNHEWQRVYLPQSVIETQSDLPIDIKETLRDRLWTSTINQFLDNQKAPFPRQRGIRRHDVNAVLTSKQAKIIYALCAIPFVIKLGVIPLYTHLTAKPLFKSAALVVALPIELPPPPPAPVASLPPAGVQPLPSSLAQQCFDAMADISDRAPTGWQIGIISCTQDAVMAAIHRTFGTIQALSSAYPRGAITYDRNYIDAEIRVPHSIAAGYHSVKLIPVDQVSQAIVTLGWQAGELPAVSEFAPPSGRAKSDPATWRQATFTIASAMLPSRWAEKLLTIPGATITVVGADAQKMIASPASFKWEIKGVLYAN